MSDERCADCGCDRTNLKHLRHDELPKGHRHPGNEFACHPFRPAPTPPTDDRNPKRHDMALEPDLCSHRNHPGWDCWAWDVNQQPAPPTDEALRALVEALVERAESHSSHKPLDIRADLDRIVALAAARPAGLDVEALAEALHESETDCWPSVDDCHEATNHRRVAVRLADYYQAALARRGSEG